MLTMEAVTGQAKRVCTRLLELARRYQEVIVRDPELAGRLESGFRLASYLVPGLLGGSWAVTETTYSAANLYCLLNDYLVTNRCPSASPLHRVRTDHHITSTDLLYTHITPFIKYDYSFTNTEVHSYAIDIIH